jgi:hypothetical protein
LKEGSQSANSRIETTEAMISCDCDRCYGDGEITVAAQDRMIHAPNTALAKSTLNRSR